MKCRFEHDEDCCNSGSPQYMCKCKPDICGSLVPMTNAGRIRSMSDEELADQLVIRIDGLEECRLYLSAPTGKLFIPRKEAVRVTLEWLRMPEEVE